MFVCKEEGRGKFRGRAMLEEIIADPRSMGELLTIFKQSSTLTGNLSPTKLMKYLAL